ncbi:MAG: hypothetical protein WD016_05930 [Balneolaceae bacterium]
MKLTNAILVIIFLVVGVSCSTTNSDTLNKNAEDVALMSEVEGQWDVKRNTIRTFNADGTFIDSTISAKSRVIQTVDGEQEVTSEVCDKEYANDMYIEKVVKGTYTIEDGFLKLKANNLLFACNPSEVNVTTPYFDASIAIEGQNLNATQARLFTRTDSGSGLEGTWETEYSAYIQNYGLQTGAGVQTLTEKVIFSENSDTFQQERSTPFGIQSYEMQYEYNPPELSVNSGNDSWDVELDGDDMNWVYNLHTAVWVKVQ